MESFPIPNRYVWEEIFYKLTKATQGEPTYKPKDFENEVFKIGPPGGDGPNFIYKPTGFEISYPECVFKPTTRMNQGLTTKEFRAIISDCIKSTKPKGRKNGNK